MTEIVKSESPRELALYFQKSGLFPDLQSEAQAYVKIVAGRELGLGPLASVSGLNVIKGRVTFSANLIASMVKRHPLYDYRVQSHDDRLCRIEFFQSGESIGISEFSADDARRAGLGGQNWNKYPKAMLFARALTQGVRWFCPDVTAGAPAYVPEEIGGDDPVQVEAEVIETPEQRPREDVRLDYLATLVEEFEFDDDQKAALRDFVRAGGMNAIETAILFLEDGNTSALWAGMEYEVGQEPSGAVR
jgi:hypothetical protein